MLTIKVTPRMAQLITKMTVCTLDDFNNTDDEPYLIEFCDIKDELRRELGELRRKATARTNAERCTECGFRAGDATYKPGLEKGDWIRI